MLRIGIAGIGGRMGREVLAAIEADPETRVAFGIARPERLETARALVGPTTPIVTDLTEGLPEADVAIDFSAPAATLALARACAARGMPLVSGTTGLSPEQLRELRDLSDRAPVFYARNMSVGVNALLGLLPALVRALDGYDVEIVEAHHRHKADAPSGTALALAEAIAAALPGTLVERAVYGRRGVAPRTAGEIGIHAVRGGGNAGEHAVVFASEGDEVRIAHRAYGRQAFALGALRAAHFVAARPPGFYTMADMITGA